MRPHRLDDRSDLTCSCVKSSLDLCIMCHQSGSGLLVLLFRNLIPGSSFLLRFCVESKTLLTSVYCPLICLSVIGTFGKLELWTHMYVVSDIVPNVISIHANKGCHFFHQLYAQEVSNKRSRLGNSEVLVLKLVSKSEERKKSNLD